jgi:hypothetical protein
MAPSEVTTLHIIRQLAARRYLSFVGLSMGGRLELGTGEGVGSRTYLWVDVKILLGTRAGMDRDDASAAGSAPVPRQSFSACTQAWSGLENSMPVKTASVFANAKKHLVSLRGLLVRA